MKTRIVNVLIFSIKLFNTVMLLKKLSQSVSIKINNITLYCFIEIREIERLGGYTVNI